MENILTYNKKHRLTVIPYDIWTIILNFIVQNKCSCFKKDIILISRNVCRAWRIRDVELSIQDKFNVTDNDLKNYIIPDNRIPKNYMSLFTPPQSNRNTNKSKNGFPDPYFRNGTIPNRVPDNHFPLFPKQKNIFNFGNDYTDLENYGNYFLNHLNEMPPSMFKSDTHLHINDINFAKTIDKCYICNESWEIDPFVLNCNHRSHKCNKDGCNNHIYISKCKCTYAYCNKHDTCNKTEKLKSECVCCLQNFRWECGQNGYHFTADLLLNTKTNYFEHIEIMSTKKIYYQPIKQNPMDNNYKINLNNQPKNGKLQRSQHNIKQPRK